VTSDVPPNAIVSGNPAQIRGYVDAEPGAAGVRLRPQATSAGPCRVRGVSVVALHVAIDARGTIAVAETGAQLPFEPRRLFFVYDVPSREVRGEHAHRAQEQLLVCVKGSCALVVDDGVRREELVLDSPSFSVHVAPMVWTVQYRFTPDAVLAVAASAEYDTNEYIRDYEEFLTLARTAPGV
jgi:UDP-2-acetamido-3-amino-2,3-dideoxy-glucuronate N-acetyltransferase